MLKWKFELKGYDIQYRPRISIKGQILTDFIVERPEEESSDELMTEPKELPEPWTLFTDGTVLSRNKKADALSKIASTSFTHLSKQVLVEELNEKSISKKEVLAIVEEEGHTWMTPICEYLTKEILPKDKKKAKAVRRKASRYAVINGTLYKKSFLGPWLRYVGNRFSKLPTLEKLQRRSCSMHSGPRSVVAKAIRTGYYWPTMHTDARKLIREFNDCQVHRPIPRNPQ
ncbi:hypothetical protein Tco_0965414 [Tanacetum coccineum]